MRTAVVAALLFAPVRGEDVCIKSYGARQQCPDPPSGHFTATVGQCYPVGVNVYEKITMSPDPSYPGVNVCRSKDDDCNDCFQIIGTFPFGDCRVPLEPFNSTPPQYEAFFPGCCEHDVDVIAEAQSLPDLSTLVTALVAGGLVETLKGSGPFTIFAPTNEAFAALPAGELEKLLKPENKAQLEDILTYHVLAAKVLSKDLKDGETAKTVEGKSVTVRLYPSGAIKINNATVQSADLIACNGVVHLIDAVLLPPNACVPAPSAPAAARRR